MTEPHIERKNLGTPWTFVMTKGSWDVEGQTRWQEPGRRGVGVGLRAEAGPEESEAGAEGGPQGASEAEGADGAGPSGQRCPLRSSRARAAWERDAPEDTAGGGGPVPPRTQQRSAGSVREPETKSKTKGRVGSGHQGRSSWARCESSHSASERTPRSVCPVVPLL